MSRDAYYRVACAAVGVTYTLVLAIVLCWERGWPLTTGSWVFLAVYVASGAVAGGRGYLSLFFFAAIVLFGFNLQRGSNYDLLFDNCRGGRGVEVSGLRLGRPGLNTPLMESYAGPLPSDWKVLRTVSPDIRDGNERVFSRNVIHRAEFPEMLEKLPHDDARRTVILCLTDPENRLRMHQALLLACLYEFDYPAGMTADTWWERHRGVFIAERDPHRALSLVHNWRTQLERIRFPVNTRYSSWTSLRRAVEFQEQGGGHKDISLAARLLEIGERNLDQEASNIGDSVVWWPELQQPSAR